MLKHQRKFPLKNYWLSEESCFKAALRQLMSHDVQHTPKTPDRKSASFYCVFERIDFRTEFRHHFGGFSANRLSSEVQELQSLRFELFQFESFPI